jgi:CRISPR-associated protein (TIGR03986 family)
MATGKVDYFDPERKFGFIRTEDGGKIHFRLSTVDRSIRLDEIKPGLLVEVQIAQGNKGPTAARVSKSTESGSRRQPEQTAHTPMPHGYRFFNPYNFARYLPDPQITAKGTADIQLMGHCAPPPHDRWVGLSGRIMCRITTVTPLFVSEGQPVKVEDNHPTYEFYKVNDKKTIPGSSMRGAVRQVFETITNSCFANFSDSRLSYRVDSRDAPRLVPGRIEQRNGHWELSLLTGTAELQTDGKPNELYAASLPQYKPIKSSSRNPRSIPPGKVSLAALGEVEHVSDLNGRECFAVLVKLKFPPAWRVLAVAANKDDAIREANELKRPGQSLRVQRGYLCISNQNIDNKHSERFFFDGGMSGGPKTITLDDLLIKRYQDLMRDYYERHTQNVKDSENPHERVGDEPAWSRFIIQDESKMQDGSLVYALLRGHSPDTKVVLLGPVSIPRAAYNHTTGDLLPEHLHHCQDINSLCPACRTFGWVRGKQTSGPGAYAGRVRFSDAVIEESHEQPPMTLSILGSPNPTTSRFYLFQPDGTPSKTARTDDNVGYDGNGGRNLLRGRKFYRHHRPNDLDLNASPSNQNRTVKDAEGPGALLSFTIDFENLAPVELGALLWSITLGGKGYQRLGFGKPLGLGSVQIDAKVQLLDVEERYSGLASNGWHDRSDEDVSTWIKTFQRAMVITHTPAKPYQKDIDWMAAFEGLPNIRDLLAMLGTKEPELAVHYPYSPDPASKGQFEWFMGNKRFNGPRIELDIAAEDTGLPLIDKHGSK